MPARIKVGISTYNDYEYLEMLLQSMDWYTGIGEPFDKVVCDDGSRPEIIEHVREVCRRFGAHLIEHTRNLGIPATWNHLAKSLDGAAEIVVILNNDLLMPPQWLDVCVHFLDANKDNPQVGSMFWNPINRVPKDMMRAMLPNLGHTTWLSHDVASGQQPDFYSSDHFDAKVGDGHGLGRVMCPCGCCFAFRMDVFREVGDFWEDLISFHEESAWGTMCAEKGRAAWGFSFPRPYHTHGASFAVNPELQAGKRMVESRRMYRHRFGVPAEIPDNAYFKHVDDRLMSEIPKTRLKYLSPDYAQAPQVVSLYGGGSRRLPVLVEKEGEF